MKNYFMCFGKKKTKKKVLLT